jgi:mRNA interferase RelE/StbE
VAALRHLRKIDRSIAAEILDYMDDRIARTGNPRDFGKALRHEKLDLWRYRVRDYRIVCELDVMRNTVVVLAIGHRSMIYD